MKRSFFTAILAALLAVSLGVSDASAQLKQTKLFVEDASGNITTLTGSNTNAITLNSSGSVLTTGNENLISIASTQVSGLSSAISAAISSAITALNLGTMSTASASNYSTTTAMNTAISSAITALNLGTMSTASASNYSTTTAMNTAISSAITALNLGTMSTASASNYSTTTAMNTAISSAITALNLGTMSTASTSNYSTTTAMNTAISSAITALNLGTMSAQSASNYSTTTAMNTAISSAIAPYELHASLGTDVAALGTLSNATTGNAGTVTNGVYTTAANVLTGANSFAPTANITGLTVKQTTVASPSNDIFDVTASNGTTKYISVSSAGVTTIAGTIQGSVSGSAATAPASGLTGATLASNVTASSLTSFGSGIALGTPASGTLTNCTFPTLNQNTSGTAAGLSSTLVVGSGGTGLGTLTPYALMAAGTTATGTMQQIAAGTTGYVLTYQGSSALPTWQPVTATATTVGTTQVSSNATYYPLMVASSTNGNQAVDLDAIGLGYNPSTNVFTIGAAGSASGSLSLGNSTSSTALTTIQAGPATTAVTYTLPAAAPTTASPYSTTTSQSLTATSAGVMKWGAYASYQTTTGLPLSAGPLTSTNLKNCGFSSGTTVITPAVSGKVLITITGSISPSGSGDGAEVQIYYGTGNGPSYDATSLTGTAAGALVVNKDISGFHFLEMPFCCTALVTGLTIGTGYFIDAAMAAPNGGTVTVNVASITATELP